MTVTPAPYDDVKAFRKESDEVYYTRAPLSVLRWDVIEFLKCRARENERLRCRLCTHANVADPFQEMIVAHHRDSNFMPHRYRERTQSFKVLEGAADVLLFDETGGITEMFAAGEEAGAFYFRIPAVYYAFLVKTEWFIFLEAAAAAFDRSKVDWAPWAASERDVSSAREYRRVLTRRAQDFASARRAET